MEQIKNLTMFSFLSINSKHRTDLNKMGFRNIRIHRTKVSDQTSTR